MSKHTPGPWKIRNKMDCLELYGSDGTCLGEVVHEPDAHLIVAAPELLGALESVMAALGFREDFAPIGILPIEVQKQVRAALAKARGKE